MKLPYEVRFALRLTQVAISVLICVLFVIAVVMSLPVLCTMGLQRLHCPYADNLGFLIGIFLDAAFLLWLFKNTIKRKVKPYLLAIKQAYKKAFDCGCDYGNHPRKCRKHKEGKKYYILELGYDNIYEHYQMIEQKVGLK